MLRLALAAPSKKTLTVLLFAWAPALVLTSRAAADTVMGAKKSKVYHTHPQECSPAQQINGENIVRFASEDEARKEGRRLCKTCQKIAERGKKKADEPSEPGKPSKKKADTEPDQEEPEDNLPSQLVDVRVKKVLTGGTLLMNNGEKVALVGVCIPQAGQPLAEEAVRHIQKQLKGRKVQLAPVTASEAKVRRDGLGRMIAYVSIGSGDADLGGELIVEGLAAVDRSMDFDRTEDYLKRQDDAAWAGRGIWKKLDGPDGEAEVVAGKHTHEYHSPDCPHVVHLTEAATLTVNEAKDRRLCPCDYFHTKENGKS